MKKLAVDTYKYRILYEEPPICNLSVWPSGVFFARSLARSLENHQHPFNSIILTQTMPFIRMSIEYRVFAIVANAIRCHAIKLMNTNVATEAKRLRFASNIYFHTKFPQWIRFILNISRATFHIIKFHCLCDSIQTPFVSISHCVFVLPSTLPPHPHTHAHAKIIEIDDFSNRRFSLKGLFGRDAFAVAVLTNARPCEMDRVKGSETIRVFGGG